MPTSKHFVDNHAKSEDVTACVSRLPTYLRGRHVADCSQHVPGTRLLLETGSRTVRAGGFAQVNFGQSEVEYLHPAIFRYEDVFGLQVTVDNPGIVSSGQACRYLCTKINRLAHPHGAVTQPLAQRFTM